MSNKNLKLTSVRIDPDTLESIEKFVRKHDYWTKNGVINNILTAVMTRFSDNDIYDMVRSWQFQREPITAIYRINAVPKLKEEEEQC